MAAAEVLTKISPTYLSTDLLTPTQKDRLTIPAIGYRMVEKRPIGGKTWGENLTNYGGIGKLPFLGKTRARDLYVTRSLKHFGSGFSHYEASVQPYQVTSLMKSACRVNDQVLPSTSTIHLDSKGYMFNFSADAASNRNPYFSHKAIFEVFPYHDPNRISPAGNPVLTDESRRDLMQQYKTIYNMRRYSNQFMDNSEVIRQRIHEKRALQSDDDAAVHSLPSERRDESSKEGPENLANIADLTEHYLSRSELGAVVAELAPLHDLLCQAGSARSLLGAREVLGLLFQYHGRDALDTIADRLVLASADMEMQRLVELALGDHSQFVLTTIMPLVKGLREAGDSVLDMLVGKVSELKAKPQQDLPPVDARQQCQTLRSFITGTNATSFDHTVIHSGLERDAGVVKGVAPLWPPSACYMLNRQHMRLQSFDSFPSNRRATLPAIPERILRQDLAAPSPANSSAPPHPKQSKQVRFADTVSSHGAGSVQDKASLEEALRPGSLEWYRKYMDSVLPQSTGANVKGRDIEEHAADTWNSIPEPCPDEDVRGRTIMDPNQHLKTLAHRRYHELHPDAVPDLRENHRFSKKYFFSGYHTSTFRG